MKDPNDERKCLNDVANDTRDLKARTTVRYALLRDIPLRNISKLPEQADGDGAEWDLAPEARKFPCRLALFRVEVR